MAYGVEQQCLKLEDLFHVDNLIVKWASITAFGETVQGMHEQIHHHQCLQCIHDIHKYDRCASQQIIDEVLEGGTFGKYKMRTTWEWQQRWLVNQRFATVILEGMAIETTDKTPAMVALAIKLNRNTDKWVRRVCGEVLLRCYLCLGL
jgi:hypothetical protein